MCNEKLCKLKTCVIQDRKFHIPIFQEYNLEFWKYFIPIMFPSFIKKFKKWRSNEYVLKIIRYTYKRNHISDLFPKDSKQTIQRDCKIH